MSDYTVEEREKAVGELQDWFINKDGVRLGGRPLIIEKIILANRQAAEIERLRVRVEEARKVVEHMQKSLTRMYHGDPVRDLDETEEWAKTWLSVSDSQGVEG